MTDNDYKPLKVQDKVLKIVENCFNKENNGDMGARRAALSELDEFLIETGDGSYTLKSEGFSETMHTHHGGLEESLAKYVKPSHFRGMPDVSVLDICSGLGYTAAVCLEYLNVKEKNRVDTKINIDMVEISPLTLATGLIIPSPLKSHEIIKKAIENKLYDIGYLKNQLIKQVIPDNIELNIMLSDARQLVKDQSNPNHIPKKYDSIFLVPFSPGVSPELYSIEFLSGIKNLLKDEGMLLTYTKSAAVRYALINSGLYVGEGPRFGRSGGTLASFSQLKIETPLSKNDERMIALSDAGTPFRDDDLNSNGFEINERRQNERDKARKDYKFASTVKSPVYLCKDISESRLKRRIMKDFIKLGFEGAVSEKSRYLVCPQYDRCICGCGCIKLHGSSERVLEMEKRLNEIIEGKFSS
jgi:tRNA U34 5-methylaminomethyl-2-thiouridine-forming methyltransferase MnmC